MNKLLLLGSASACALGFSISTDLLAANLSFTGLLSADDDVQLFNFTSDGASLVTLRTYSYAGGVQADGNVVSAGGFDPILALFDSAGNYINQNDDDETDAVAFDPNTGQAWDALFSEVLAAGDYTVAIMQFDNFANGPTLSDGFSQQGNPFFTATFGCSNGQFCDISEFDPFNNRTNEWAFDILSVVEGDIVPAPAPVPVPAAAWLFGSGLLGLIGISRCKKTV